MCQSRLELAAKKKNLIHKHELRNSHSPHIGVNAFREVESNKDEFFSRLHKHQEYQQKLREVNSRELFHHEMGRDVRKDKVLDAKTAKQLLQRLELISIDRCYELYSLMLWCSFQVNSC